MEQATGKDQAVLERRWFRQMILTALVSGIAGAWLSWSVSRHSPTAASTPPQASFPPASTKHGNTHAVIPSIHPASAPNPPENEVSTRFGQLAEQLDDMPPEEAIALLDREKQQLAILGNEAADRCWNRLLTLHDRVAEAVLDTPAETAAARARWTAYREAGWWTEHVAWFDNHVHRIGERARRAALEAEESPLEAARMAQRAMAEAYFDETMTLYHGKDYAGAVFFSERLLARYPASARAYEGLVIAARCFLTQRQTSAAADCYRRIVERCPDEHFAREAARIWIGMLVRARRNAEALGAARSLRERFSDRDFRQFSLLREMEILRSEGIHRYSEAMDVFHELRGIDPVSSFTKQGERWVRDMRRQTVGDLLEL